MITAKLDPKFKPMITVINEFNEAVKKAGGVPMVIAVERNDSYMATYEMDIFPEAQVTTRRTTTLLRE